MRRSRAAVSNGLPIIGLPPLRPHTAGSGGPVWSVGGAGAALRLLATSNHLP
jgi:hypothetical protein